MIYRVKYFRLFMGNIDLSYGSEAVNIVTSLTEVNPVAT